MGRFWLALLLLISTLSSAPAGSMEQDAPASSWHVAHATALPAIRHASNCGVANALAEPEASRAPLLLSPFLPARSGPPLSAAPLLTARCGASAHDVVPLCERLPYHANAPPA